VNSVLRPMSTAEILDRTFSLYRNNFLLFAGIAILPALIAFLLEVVGVTAHITVRVPGRTFAEAQVMTFAYALLVFFIESVIGGSIATGATVFAVYHLHLGKPATVGGSYKNVLASWFRVIVAAVIAFFVVVVLCGAVLFVLILAIFYPLSRMDGRGNEPFLVAIAVIVVAVIVLLCWVYLTGWLSFVVPALLLDKNTIFHSFRRSHRLSKGSRRRIFFALLLTLFLTLAFTWSLRVPVYIIFNRRLQEIPFQMWTYVAQFLSAVLAGPIATIAIALFYIDQRVRQEAFDLHLMLQSIEESDGFALPAAPTT
jgi:hypothetical protein